MREYTEKMLNATLYLIMKLTDARRLKPLSRRYLIPEIAESNSSISVFSSSARLKVLLSTLGVFTTSAVFAVVERFPRPEFESGYDYPTTTVPMPPSGAIHVLDLTLLLLALSAASYFAIKARSRKGVATTLILSLLYFGFYRGGCVCVVGSIQNVSLALFNNSYQVSWVVFAFFAAPIVFTLFFGRAFCGAVCPLGAIQDIFIMKPLKVPRWLEEVLGMIPYLYLGLAVLFAATGTGFIICRADFFVGFFRFSGPLHKMILGGALLALGIFIARPYCRFLCPYGVLLRWASLVSWKHLKISPADCVKCSLCVDACPFGAVREPVPAKLSETRTKGVRRLAILILALPFAIGVGAFAGRVAGPMLATVNPIVRMAQSQEVPEDASAKDVELAYDASIAKKGAEVEKEIIFGSTLLGVFIGLVIALKLIALSIRRSNDRFTPEQAKCLECARCLPACPVPPPSDTEEQNENKPSSPMY